MTLAAKAAAVFGYRVLPTALLTFVTYLAIIVAIVVTDVLPDVPKPNGQRGLSFGQAYNDLQHITAHPHPYNSHANDQVRAYLLERLTVLERHSLNMHVIDDLTSNKTWLSTDLPLGGAHAAYFEGTNILVKVDGTAGSTTGGVLFSAHYDSVSTACGATDDGMGVATLLQLIGYLAVNRPLRTAVFNINNGEEDGLHGAHAFLEHPWSKLTDTFVNLEGAASGGRPILFRATSTTPVRAVRNQQRVPHPHANVLSSDAFARGLIKSGTDFSVYAGGAGMAGLDLAFYKGRSMYHTKYDSVQYTVGGQRSLWSMMEVALGIGIGLLSEPLGDKGDTAEVNDDAVYFDLFKSAIIVFRLKSLLTFNVVALIVGPTLLALLLFCERFFLGGSGSSSSRNDDDTVRPLLRDDLSSRTDSRTTNTAHTGLPSPALPTVPRFGFGRRRTATPIPGSHQDEEDDEDGMLHARRRRPAEAEAEVARSGRAGKAQWVWRHAKFWVALVAVVGLQVLLAWGFVAINPFAIYSSPYLILFSFASLVYLVLINVLTLPSSLPFFHPKSPPPPASPHPLLRPAQQQKQTLFFHLYAFTWALLLLGTLGITLVHSGVGGGYLLSAWNACVGAACGLTVVEGLLTTSRREREEEEREEEERYEELVVNEDAADESTPLIWGERRRGANSNSARIPGRQVGTRDDARVGRREGEGLGTWWWIAQFLVSVPVPVMLFGQVAMMLLDSLPQTLADGGAPWLVYALTVIPAVFLILPLAPFAYKLRPSRVLSFFVLAVFVGTTVYTWLAFPFSIDAPLKIFFQQTVAFPRQAGGGSAHDIFTAPTVLTSLTGAKRYLRTHLIPSLPSAQRKAVWCTDEPSRPHLATCKWDSSSLPPVPGSSVSHSALGSLEPLEDGGRDGVHPELGGLDVRRFFKAQITSTGPHSAFISVQGRNTRACRVYFDSVPIEKYAVHHLNKTSSASSPVTWSATAAAGRKDGDTDGQAAFVASSEASSGAGEIKQLRLWSRTWEQELGVEFSWAAPSSAKSNSTTVMEGRIACEWAEYESGMVDNGSGALGVGGGANSMGAVAGQNTRAGQVQSGAKIPALEEALAYLPDWAVITKFSDGLVEAWMPFVV